MRFTSLVASGGVGLACMASMHMCTDMPPAADTEIKHNKVLASIKNYDDVCLDQLLFHIMVEDVDAKKKKAVAHQFMTTSFTNGFPTAKRVDAGKAKSVLENVHGSFSIDEAKRMSEGEAYTELLIKAVSNTGYLVNEDCESNDVLQRFLLVSALPKGEFKQMSSTLVVQKYFSNRPWGLRAKPKVYLKIFKQVEKKLLKHIDSKKEGVFQVHDEFEKYYKANPKQFRNTAHVDTGESAMLAYVLADKVDYPVNDRTLALMEAIYASGVVTMANWSPQNARLFLSQKFYDAPTFVFRDIHFKNVDYETYFDNPPIQENEYSHLFRIMNYASREYKDHQTVYLAKRIFDTQLYGSRKIVDCRSDDQIAAALDYYVKNVKDKADARFFNIRHLCELMGPYRRQLIENRNEQFVNDVFPSFLTGEVKALNPVATEESKTEGTKILSAFSVLYREKMEKEEEERESQFADQLAQQKVVIPACESDDDDDDEFGDVRDEKRENFIKRRLEKKERRAKQLEEAKKKDGKPSGNVRHTTKTLTVVDGDLSETSTEAEDEEVSWDNLRKGMKKLVVTELYKEDRYPFNYLKAVSSTEVTEKDVMKLLNIEDRSNIQLRTGFPENINCFTESLDEIIYCAAKNTPLLATEINTLFAPWYTFMLNTSVQRFVKVKDEQGQFQKYKERISADTPEKQEILARMFARMSGTRQFDPVPIDVTKKPELDVPLYLSQLKKNNVVAEEVVLIANNYI